MNILRTNFSLQNFSHRAVDLLHGAVGYLGAQMINRHDRWLHPVSSRLGAPPLVNPWHGLACGLTFTLVDHLAQYAFAKMIKDPQVLNKPITTLVRLAISISVTALIMSPILHITVAMAVALITISIIGTLIFLGLAKAYHALTIGEQKPLKTERKVIDLSAL